MLERRKVRAVAEVRVAPEAGTAVVDAEKACACENTAVITIANVAHDGFMSLL